MIASQKNIDWLFYENSRFDGGWRECVSDHVPRLWLVLATADFFKPNPDIGSHVNIIS
jgi:hypothetical protein